MSSYAASTAGRSVETLQRERTEALRWAQRSSGSWTVRNDLRDESGAALRHNILLCAFRGSALDAPRQVTFTI